MQRSPCGCFASLLKPQMPFLLTFTIIRQEQLQQVLIWKHSIRKPGRVLLSTISCSLTVGNEIFQQQDTCQLSTAHTAELLRPCDKTPGQVSGPSCFCISLLSCLSGTSTNSFSNFHFLSILKAYFPYKTNSFLCTCRLYIHKKTPQTEVDQGLQ